MHSLYWDMRKCVMIFIRFRVRLDKPKPILICVYRYIYIYIYILCSYQGVIENFFSGRQSQTLIFLSKFSNFCVIPKISKPQITRKHLCLNLFLVSTPRCGLITVLTTSPPTTNWSITAYQPATCHQAPAHTPVLLYQSRSDLFFSWWVRIIITATIGITDPWQHRPNRPLPSRIVVTHYQCLDLVPPICFRCCNFDFGLCLVNFSPFLYWLVILQVYLQFKHVGWDSICSNWALSLRFFSPSLAIVAKKNQSMDPIMLPRKRLWKFGL